MHAYLIMAHDNWAILNLLLKSIDDERNAVFLHIDAKVKDVPSFILDNSSLTVMRDRIDVRWGDLSVVEAELALFEKAVEQGPFEYYHLLSGADLPLWSQDHIHSFCSDNEGKEFLGYTLLEIPPELRRKVQRWHFFPDDFKGRSLPKKVIRALFLRIQEWFGIIRNKNIDFKKGTQWASLTENMVRLLLSNKDWIEKTFSHTFCPDEVYKQTLCWNSPLRDNIYCIDNDAHGCMRAIGWKNGDLKDWGKEDYDILGSSEALFARKFNSSDMEFVNKIIALQCRK